MPWVGGEMPDAFVRVLADFAVHVSGCGGTRSTELGAMAIRYQAKPSHKPLSCSLCRSHYRHLSGIVPL